MHIASVPRPSRWSVLLLILLLGACQGRATPGPEPEITGVLPLDPRVIEEPPATTPPTRARAEPRGYAADKRVAALVEGWPAVVDRAAGRLELVTGLKPPADVKPQVLLVPFGDETRTWETGAEILDGRRVPVVRVNLEPIAAGREEPERVVLQALAATVYEETAARFGPVPPWVVRTAEIVAGGDLEARLTALQRRVETDGAVAAAVEPDDPAHREATALAATLVLLETGEPDAVRRFLRFTAEGDDAGQILARVLHDPLGTWSGAGRRLLDRRLAEIDTSPWRMLEGARRALEEAGRAALETELPEVLPYEVEPEIQVLRARAHADEGDFESARRLLRSLELEDWGRLVDPVHARALQIRTEDHTGGDPALAAELREEWLRDFPRARIRTERGEAPELESVAMGAGDFEALERGARAMELAEARYHLARLLAEHRAGSARRLIDAMGERGRAPELEGVRQAVADAEEQPGPESVAVNRKRVRTWLLAPGPRTAAEVVTGGAAAGEALVESLSAVRGPERRAAIRLLGDATEPGRAVGLLLPSWRMDPRHLSFDLDALASTVPYRELRLWVEGQAADVLARVNAPAIWSGLRLAIDEAWLETHPGFLGRLRDERFAVRREAFAAAVNAGQITPDLVARGLADPAPLLRREAAQAAGLGRFQALVREALRDDAWVVRQAACGAAVSAFGRDAANVLLPLYRRDVSPPVRLAATNALLTIAAGNRRVQRALVDGLADESSSIRARVTQGLPALAPDELLRPLWKAMVREASRAEPRTAFLSHLFRVFQRTAGWDPRYYPGMPKEELDAVIRRVAQTMRSVEIAARREAPR